MSRIITRVQNCPLFWGRLYCVPDQSHVSGGAYTWISFCRFTKRHGYTIGPAAEYLISLCDEFVRICISGLCLKFVLLKNWNNSSLFALLSILRSFCHFAPLSWGILDEISVCHPAVTGSVTWDFPSYMYRKLYPLFCRLESTDSPWVVAGVSRPTHQTHKNTGVLPGKLWLAYPLNDWCMVGIFGAVPRFMNAQKTTKKCRLGIGFQWSDKYSSSGWLSYLKKSLMSASGRASRVNGILVMSTAFALADSRFVATFVRPTGDLLLKVCKPTLGMTTAMGLKPFSICIDQILWI